MPKIFSLARTMRQVGQGLIGNSVASLFPRTGVLPPIRMASQAQVYVRPGVTPCLEPERFFNRNRECKDVEAILNQDPQISVFLGPPNSGKTTLLRHVLSQMAAKKRPILHIDLRNVSFNTPEGVYRIFAEESLGLLQRIHAMLPETSIKVDGSSIFGIGPDFEVTLAKKAIETEAAKERNSADKLNVVFEVISRALPQKTLFGFKTNPVLFIDEANELKALLKHPDGQDVLRNLFKWFVGKTKQEARFHVILGSSSSFFHLWLSRFVNQDHYKSYVIGNLDQQEAARYWAEKVVPDFDWSGHAPPPFKMAYDICGGNMMHMKQLALQWTLNKGHLRREGFDLVIGALERLRRACRPEYFTESLARHYQSPDSREPEPKWSKDQLLEVLQQLVHTQEGFLIRDELCQKIKQSVIDSMIEHHLLHLRPRKEFSYDLPSAPDNNAIVTPVSQADLYAMRLLLQEYGKLPKPTNESKESGTAQNSSTSAMRP
ncbi:MAG: hypothetical protein A3H43_05275 [Gammaproteobacteria bacterium RIFCSPLOWO2_02_FULL_42_9]|nr:MAG: hypothetical protein A3H43_05275 [Gammaproteobacteria bacterium RIFCSPLOWO2_02_FULL_42_9]